MQRSKSKTTKVPVGNKMRLSGTNQVKPVKKDSQAKENLQKLKTEIEDSFKPQNLPNQKMHPFDLSPEEIAELKEEFPEFQKKKTESGQQRGQKNMGLTIQKLKQLLREKIKVTDEQMEVIISKFDHKSESKITWTEFLAFLSNEGQRREIVNDAQLYGFGVKRIEFKERIKLTGTKEKPVSDKAVEYYIEKLVLIQSDKFQLLLTIFENNQARLYDCRNFQAIQDIEFPNDYMTAKAKNAVREPSRSQLKPQVEIGTVSKEPPSFSHLLSSSTLNPFEQAVSIKIENAPAENLLDVIAEAPMKKTKTKSSETPQKLQPMVARPKSQLQLQQNPINSIQKQQQLRPVSRAQKMLDSAEKSAYEDELGPKPVESFKQKGNRMIFAYKEYPYDNIWQKKKDGDDQIRDPYILGISQINDNEGKMVTITKPDEIQKINSSICVADIYPSFKEDYAVEKVKFIEKEKRTQKEILECERYLDKKFNTAMEHERAHNSKMSKADLCKIVVKKIGYQTTAAHEIIKKGIEKHLQECRSYSNRCAIKLTSLNKNFDKQKLALEKLDECNKYHFRRRDFEMIKTGNSHANLMPNTTQVEKVTPDMVAAYIDKCKQNGELSPDKSPQHNKMNERKNHNINVAKAVYTVATDFNEELGLTALALIDKEVRIYHVKQSGAKIQLSPAFSFYAKFPGDSVAVSSLQLQRYVTNGRPIIVMGSLNGDICILYIDLERSMGNKPMLLAKFNFHERGVKIENEDGDKDSLDETQASRHAFSIKSMNRSTVTHINRKQSDRQNEVQYSQTESQMVQTIFSDPAQQITDDFWENIIMNTRPKQDGPDAIKIWNLVKREVKSHEQAQRLVKELMQIKLTEDDYTDKDKSGKIKKLIQRWQICSRIHGGRLDDTAQAFKEQTLNPDAAKKGGRDSFKATRSAVQTPDQQINKRTRGLSMIGPRPTQAALSNQASFARQESVQPGSLLEMKTDAGATNAVSGHKKVEEITCIKYVRDVGLIATTLNGCIKIFDAFSFHQIWKNSNQNRSASQHTSVSTFDVSQQLGLMATVGVEGRMLLIDPYALGIINATDAHPNTEIINVYIYTSQLQIITIAVDRTINLWDAYRLEKIQTIKDVGQSHVMRYSSSCFDQATGILYTGCQQINIWKAIVNSKVQINALQTRGLEISEKADSKNGKVLVSKTSKLVRVLVNEFDTMNFLITVDSENLLRGWSMKDCKTAFNYQIPMKKRVTAACVDDDSKFIAVGNCVGEVKVLNFSSGGVMYTLPCQRLEITSLKFLNGKSEFWIVAGCWGGKIVTWTEPSEDNNFQISAKCRIGHRGDVLVLDSAHNYIISGGIDGLVSVWNQFSGVLKFAITLPDPFDEKLKQPDNTIRKTIVDVMFHPSYSNVICALQESGNVHMIDISNNDIIAEFVAFLKVNSSWACSPKLQKVFAVGDLGRASLFSIQFGESLQSSVKKTNRSNVYSGGKIKDYKWQQLRPWFRAHDIGRVEHFFVSQVKYAARAGIFISSTTHGEVKLWSEGADSNDNQCMPLGTLNAKDWSNSKVLGYIKMKDPNLSYTPEEIHQEELVEDADGE